MLIFDKVKKKFDMIVDDYTDIKIRKKNVDMVMRCERTKNLEENC